MHNDKLIVKVYPPLEEIGLSNRSYNALRRGRIQTTELLIKAVENGEIYNVRYLGSTSIAEIKEVVGKIAPFGGLANKETNASVESTINIHTNAVAKYFSDRKFKRFREYCAESGISSVSDLKNMDMTALLTTPWFGPARVDAIKERLAEIPSVTVEEGKNKIVGVVVHKFDSIHPTNENLPISILGQFDMPSGLVNKLIEQGLKMLRDLKNAPKAEIVQWLGIQSFRKLERVVVTFSDPLVNLMSDFFEKHKEDKSFKIYLQRAKGMTLHEIGDACGLSRERIRQCSVNFEQRFMPYALALAKNTEEQCGFHYIRESQLDGIFSKEEYNESVKHALKESTEYGYIAGLYFNSEHYPLAERTLETVVANIVGDGISFFSNVEDIENKLAAAGYDVLNAYDFLNLAVCLGYVFYSDFIVKSKASYSFLCSKIIEEHYPQGVRFDSESINKIRVISKQRFGSLSLPNNDKAFESQLKKHLVRCDKSTYMAPQNVQIGEELLNDIKHHIDNSTQDNIFYKELFATFKEKLEKDSNVNCPTFLCGLLSYKYPHEYIYHRDRLTGRSGGSGNALGTQIKHLISAAGRPVSKDEIIAHIPGLEPMVLYNLAINTKGVVLWENGYYNCVDNLTISSRNKAYLLASIEDIMKKHCGYCNENLLYDATKDTLANYYNSVGIRSPQNLFYAISTIFEGEFAFRRPHIAKIGVFEKLYAKDILLQMLGAPDKLMYDEYMSFASSLMIPPVTANLAFADIEKDYVRVSRKEYIRKSQFPINNDDLNNVKALLSAHALSKWYIPLKTVAKSGIRLSNGTELNDFIIDSIVRDYDIGWQVVHPINYDRRYQRGIIIASGQLFSYDSLVANIFISEGVTRCSKDDLLSFMQERQLVDGSIPSEILSSSLFQKDETGKILIAEEKAAEQAE